MNSIVNIKTIHIDELKKLFDIIQCIEPEIPIHFMQNENGKKYIKISALNQKKNIIVNVILDDIYLNEFTLRENRCVYVNIETLLKSLKSFNKSGILSMYILENDPGRIVLSVADDNKKKISTHKINLLTIDYQIFGIDKIKYDYIIEMNCTEFHKTCKSLSCVNKYMEIVCDSKSIYFGSRGDLVSVKETYLNGLDAENVKIKTNGDDEENSDTFNDDEEKKDDDIVVKLIFDTKTINLLHKCTNLKCDTVKIYLKNNEPMYVSYKITILGILRIGINPITIK